MHLNAAPRSAPSFAWGIPWAETCPRLERMSEYGRVSSPGPFLLQTVDAIGLNHATNLEGLLPAPTTAETAVIVGHPWKRSATTREDRGNRPLREKFAPRLTRLDVDDRFGVFGAGAPHLPCRPLPRRRAVLLKPLSPRTMFPCLIPKILRPWGPSKKTSHRHFHVQDRG